MYPSPLCCCIYNSVYMDPYDKTVKLAILGASALLGSYLLYRSIHSLSKLLQGSKQGKSIRDLVAATSSPSLVRLSTSQVYLTDGGLRFCVSLLDSANPKPERSEQPTDPFMYPFEPGIFICDLGEHYRLLFNKYYISKGHTLIVTKKFEEQNKPLTLYDFEVMREVTQDMRALAFFNSGPESGFSQPHKHIQVIPFESMPIGLWREVEEMREEGPYTLPSFSFRHFFYRFTPGISAANQYQAYCQLLKLLGVTPEQHSYNLIVTSRWMLMVLRDKAYAFNRISINALGFIGLILVKSREDLDLVQKAGPLAVIRDVSCRL